jgi:hypothetical protein
MTGICLVLTNLMGRAVWNGEMRSIAFIRVVRKNSFVSYDNLCCCLLKSVLLVRKIHFVSYENQERNY